MLLAIGTKVRIRHTGEQGIVSQFLGDDMIEVYLPLDDMSIPVSKSDLVDPAEKVQKDPLPPKLPLEERIPPPEQQFMNLRPKGLQLAFEAMDDGDSFAVFLINDTREQVLFSFRKLIKGASVKSNHGKVDASEALQIDQILKTQLSDQLNYEIDCWPVKAGGSGKKRSKLIKVRPKGFFKNIQVVPVLHRKMHWYNVVESFKEQEVKKESLKSYTQKNWVPKAVRKDDDLRHYTQHDLVEFASFIPEIDLHIESLHPDADALKGKDILRYQLQEFDAFLEKAIRLGVDRVFAIHGIGKGKLRNALFTRLMSHPEVVTFKNEYHPKYGYGATEIVL